MSQVEYKSREIEEPATRKPGNIQRSKPFAMPTNPGRPGDQVTRRVAEALDYELAQGSMPA